MKINQVNGMGLTEHDMCAVETAGNIMLERMIENKNAGHGCFSVWEPDKYDAMEGVLRNIQNIATAIKYGEHDQVTRNCADVIIYMAKISELFGTDSAFSAKEKHGPCGP